MKEKPQIYRLKERKRRQGKRRHAERTAEPVVVWSYFTRKYTQARALGPEKHALGRASGSVKFRMFEQKHGLLFIEFHSQLALFSQAGGILRCLQKPEPVLWIRFIIFFFSDPDSDPALTLISDPDPDCL